MTRVLIVCLLAVLLGQPAAAGTGASTDDQTAVRPHSLDANGRGDVSAAAAFWLRTQTPLSKIVFRSISANPASLTSAAGSFSRCSQTLAFSPDLKCVTACDTAKESCDNQCGVVRARCLAQCPGLGFACDYYCHAAYFVCKANCGKAHDACVSNCPTRGGEKES